MSSESFVVVGGVAAVALAMPVVLAAAGILAVGSAVAAGVGVAAKTIGEQAHEIAQERRAKFVEQHAGHQAMIKALDEAISEIEGARASLGNALEARFARAAHGGAVVEDLGSFAIDARDPKTWQQLLEEARNASTVERRDVTEPTDLATQFSNAVALQEQVRLGKEGYIEQVRSRLSRLVPLGSAERASVDRMWERIDELERSSLSAEMIKENVAAPLEDLCARLDEGATDQRHFLYSSYLGLCALLRESPRDLSYEAMEHAVTLLSEQHLKNVMDRHLPTMRDAFDEALGLEGLEAVRSTTVDEMSGTLYAEAGNEACGLFVAPVPDGGILFVTVGADDLDSLDEQTIRRLEAHAQDLCKKKDAALEYLDATYGFKAELIDEVPVEAACIPYCSAFAEHLDAKSMIDHERRSDDGKRERAGWQNSAVAGRAR